MTRPSRAIAWCLFSLIGLELLRAADEADVIGEFDVNCAFRVTNYKKVGKDRSFELPDHFIFDTGNVLSMEFFVPGDGTWAFNATKNTWSGDMSAAVDPFLEAMLGFPVDVLSMGLKKVTAPPMAIDGKLRGKWKNHKNGTTFRSKLKGHFSGIETH